ncbi:MAG: KOW motif-containing protein [Nanoarchaeota archaeon]|nr:KOW motif-containing protein [Nanoarchaeota archaeon]
MSHSKINATPKTWPIPRKGKTFIVNPKSTGIPLIVIMRDILNLVGTRKELKRIIHEKNITVSGKEVYDEKKNIELFDTISLKPLKKSYRLTFDEKGKYSLEEIKDSDALSKISKIVNKKTLKKKKSQINLFDGRNYLTDQKVSVNDSVLIDLKGHSIKKVLPFKEKANVLVIGGKHTGKIGTVEKINNELKMAEIKTKQGKFNVLIKQLMVTE